MTWKRVSRADTLRAIKRLRPTVRSASSLGMVSCLRRLMNWPRKKRRYPPKAIFGTAYDFATANDLARVTSRSGRQAP